jgi:hypothetical protein
MAENMTMRVFWDIVPCSLAVDRCFRGAYYLLTLVIEAVCTSETSFYSSENTPCNNPDGSRQVTVTFKASVIVRASV